MNKTIWLARLLYRHENGLTRREILDAWSQEDDCGQPMPVSTFYDNRNALEMRFGLRVVRVNGRYRLAEQPGDSEALLQQLLRVSAPDEAADAPRNGDEWLPVLADAVAHNRHLLMEYVPLDKPAYETTLDPYFLRQIHGHCYVVGRSGRHGEVRNFAVDRIELLTVRPGTFRRPSGLDAARWFATSFGAFAGTHLTPEHVVLESATGRLTAYFRQRPLHPSQREETVGGHPRFHLDVALTPDFVGQLLTLGTDVAIVSPAHLRRLVGQRAQAIADACRAAEATVPEAPAAPDEKNAQTNGRAACPSD